MVICAKCGIINPEGSTFCSNCGSPIIEKRDDSSPEVKICPNCRASNPSFSTFCANCGKTLGELEVLVDERPPREAFAPPPVHMSAVNVITSGVDFLRAYPKVLWIVLFISAIDIAFQVILLGQIIDPFSFITESFYSGEQFLVEDFYEIIFQYILLMILSAIFSFFIGIIFANWTLTTYKETRTNGNLSNETLDLQKTFADSLKYFFRLIGARIVATVIIFGFAFITVFIFIIVIFSFMSVSLGYGSIMMFLLLILLFVVVEIVILVMVMVRLNYISQAIVMDDAGVFESLSKSNKFSRKYFSSTLGAVILFLIIGGAIGGLIPSTFIFITIPITRSISVIEITGFAWAFDKFRDKF